MYKVISCEKEMQEGKVVAWGGLKNSWERDMKDKAKWERYTQLNVDFQRLSRREKKAFLSEECKEIKEKNRMRNTRDIFKKIEDTREYIYFFFLLVGG